ncbi:MAG: hypothetical protein GX493_10205 [Firmicutes bacterium]|nr:hypothetical protein [Bacillota bacterium]
MEKYWWRVLFFFLFGWLLLYWSGLGGIPAIDLRRAALWAVVLLCFFLLCRDGRLLLLRLGVLRTESPLSILELRLAKGEIDLATYRALREELLASAGITRANENRLKGPVLRGERRS